MSNIGRNIAREMAKNGGGKVIVGRVIGSAVSPDMEWIKWLSYEPDFEKIRTEYLNAKEPSGLSYEELEEVIRYSKNKTYARLFRIYGTSECSEEDTMKVYDYMCNECIEDMMLSKLTPEEIEYGKKEITKWSQLPEEELHEKIKQESQEEVYEAMSMVDAFILHVIAELAYKRSINSISTRINAQIQMRLANKNMPYNL